MSEEKKLVGMIDFTPKWRGIMPIILHALQNGTPEGKKMAEEELYALADFVDEINEERKITNYDPSL